MRCCCVCGEPTSTGQVRRSCTAWQYSKDSFHDIYKGSSGKVWVSVSGGSSSSGSSNISSSGGSGSSNIRSSSGDSGSNCSSSVIISKIK